jgi:hypothetical protein
MWMAVSFDPLRCGALRSACLTDRPFIHQRSSSGRLGNNSRLLSQITLGLFATPDTEAWCWDGDRWVEVDWTEARNKAAPLTPEQFRRICVIIYGAEGADRLREGLRQLQCERANNVERYGGINVVDSEAAMGDQQG